MQPNFTKFTLTQILSGFKFWTSTPIPLILDLRTDSTHTQKNNFHYYSIMPEIFSANLKASNGSAWLPTLAGGPTHSQSAIQKPVQLDTFSLTFHPPRSRGHGQGSSPLFFFLSPFAFSSCLSFLSRLFHLIKHNGGKIPLLFHSLSRSDARGRFLSSDAHKPAMYRKPQKLYFDTLHLDYLPYNFRKYFSILRFKMYFFFSPSIS